MRWLARARSDIGLYHFAYNCCCVCVSSGTGVHAVVIVVVSYMRLLLPIVLSGRGINCPVFAVFPLMTCHCASSSTCML